MTEHFVYIVESKNNQFYTGYTTDLEHRMQQHKEGKGSKFLRAFGFSKLLYHEVHPTKSEALKREIQIKKMSRVQKVVLMRSRQTTS